MKKTTLLILYSLFSLSVQAQYQTDPGVKLEQMKKLAYMVGTWEGSGWAQDRDGQTHTYNQTEVIQLKLGGTVLLIEGTGKHPHSGEITFNAMAIVSFNETSGKYDFRSYLSTGQSTNAEGYFEEDRFIWSFDTGGGTVRYTMTFTEDSKWIEIGEFSQDGTQWYKFMEMNLEKTSL